VALSYNAAGQAAGLPERVFTKAAPTRQSRMALASVGKGAIEAGFYREFRPHLDVEVPPALFAAWDKRTGRSFFVFEDIVDKLGVEFCSPTFYVDRKLAESMVELLAQCHGTFWESPKLTSTSWLIPVAQWQDRINHALSFENCSRDGIARSRDNVPEEFVGRDDDLWRAHMDSLKLAGDSPGTLVHWDVHIGNWYCTQDGRAGLSDWGSFRGPWAGDFGYTLASALTTEDRLAWEKDLLRLYLDRLQAAGGPRLSFDDAWLSYRQQMFHAFFYWVMTLGSDRLLPLMQPEQICRTNISRTAQALVDLESLAAVLE
jgi:aminoglycoside phosphotransferase (APT) family kinase protein